MGSTFSEIVVRSITGTFWILVALLGGFLESVPADTASEATERYREGNWAQAVELYDEGLSSLDGVSLVRYGEALTRIRKFDRAETIFGRIDRETAVPDETRIRARAAHHFLTAERGNPEVAVKILEGLVAEYPESYWARLYLGRALKRLGRWEDALTELYTAGSIVSRDYWVHFEIGEVYEELFLFDLAMEAYKESLFYNPRYGQAVNNLGYCYKEKSVLVPGVTLYSYAVEKYLEAIAIQPDNAGFYYNVGNAYTHLDKLDLAFDAYSRAVELDPEFAKAHYNLGRTWKRFNRLEESINSFELYLKYGNQAVFDFVRQPGPVREEIEEMKKTLKKRRKKR